mgnify:CR=1 FL=1
MVVSDTPNQNVKIGYNGSSAYFLTGSAWKGDIVLTRDASEFTMQQLLSLNNTFTSPSLAFINWNSKIAPDANLAYVFLIKGSALAISFSGRIYKASDTDPTWKAI